MPVLVGAVPSPTPVAELPRHINVEAVAVTQEPSLVGTRDDAALGVMIASEVVRWPGAIAPQDQFSVALST